MSPIPTSAERQAAASFYDHLDPIVRAKALYSLLKEQGLPDEYVEAVKWLIEEVEQADHRAQKAERECAEVRQWFATAMQQLEEMKRRQADPHILQPQTKNQRWAWQRAMQNDPDKNPWRY